MCCSGKKIRVNHIKANTIINTRFLTITSWAQPKMEANKKLIGGCIIVALLVIFTVTGEDIYIYHLNERRGKCKKMSQGGVFFFKKIVKLQWCLFRCGKKEEEERWQSTRQVILKKRQWSSWSLFPFFQRGKKRSCSKFFYFSESSQHETDGGKKKQKKELHFFSTIPQKKNKQTNHSPSKHFILSFSRFCTNGRK